MNNVLKGLLLTISIVSPYTQSSNAMMEPTVEISELVTSNTELASTIEQILKNQSTTMNNKMEQVVGEVTNQIEKVLTEKQDPKWFNRNTETNAKSFTALEEPIKDQINSIIHTTFIGLYNFLQSDAPSHRILVENLDTIKTSLDNLVPSPNVNTTNYGILLRKTLILRMLVYLVIALAPEKISEDTLLKGYKESNDKQSQENFIQQMQAALANIALFHKIAVNLDLLPQLYDKQNSNDFVIEMTTRVQTFFNERSDPTIPKSRKTSRGDKPYIKSLAVVAVSGSTLFLSKQLPSHIPGITWIKENPKKVAAGLCIAGLGYVWLR